MTTDEEQQNAAKTSLDSMTDLFRVCGRKVTIGPRFCFDIRGLSDPESIWSHPEISLTEILDGAANTILLVAIQLSEHSWSDDWDPDIDDLYRPAYFGSSPECEGLVMAFADGKRWWLPPALTKQELH